MQCNAAASPRIAPHGRAWRVEVRRSLLEVVFKEEEGEEEGEEEEEEEEEVEDEEKVRVSCTVAVMMAHTATQSESAGA